MWLKLFFWVESFITSLLFREQLEQGIMFMALHLSITYSTTFVTDEGLTKVLLDIFRYIIISIFVSWVCFKVLNIDFFVVYQIVTLAQCFLFNLLFLIN